MAVAVLVKEGCELEGILQLTTKDNAGGGHDGSVQHVAVEAAVCMRMVAKQSLGSFHSSCCFYGKTTMVLDTPIGEQLSQRIDSQTLLLDSLRSMPFAQKRDCGPFDPLEAEARVGKWTSI